MMARSFQWRIMLLLLGLVAFVQFPTFVAVNYAIQRNVLERADQELDLGAKVFARLLSGRGTQLRDTVQVVAVDFGFREAVATGDENTMRSVLFNHGSRINASFALTLGLDGRVNASTTSLIPLGTDFPFSAIFERARAESLVSGIAALDERPFQIVVAPVKAPELIGWISMGFALDQTSVDEFGSLTGLEVSLATSEAEKIPRLLSTLPVREQAQIVDRLSDVQSHIRAATFGSNEYLTRVVPLGKSEGTAVWAVLQTSSVQALRPYGVLKNHLKLISALSLLLSAFGAWLLARGVTHPVRELVAAARRIGRGDYQASVAVSRKDELGELAHVFNHMQRGISEREQQIAHQAFHDVLTGLPNRGHVEEHLANAIAQFRASASPIAVMMIDLNRFKEINDTLGHPIGDRLLVGLGQRLRSAVRRSDVVARLGGDEFLIVLCEVDREKALELSEKIVLSATQSMHFESMDVYPDISIGIAIHPQHGDNAADLIRRADIAMYDAKQSRTSVAMYETGRDATHLRRLSLVNELRRAVAHDELVVHYQPKVMIGEHCPTHVEALVRWQHPREGLIPPDDFIPLAEQAGTIHLLTDWMLRHVIRQCRQWTDAGFDLGVAVNLSALDLATGNLPAIISGYLEEYGVAPGRLLLEITESTVMRDANHALEVLSQLKACGVHLAIDDFGTGYSSLAHLKRLPVDEIKIDKSFVMSMTEDEDDAVIVRSTIELGHNMGLSVVAEGVESGRALDMLKHFHCDMAQGFLISRPLPPEELEQWLWDRCEQAPHPHPHSHRHAYLKSA
jgi:diguanylate cyclase (GGDEF)-like protein